MRFPPGETISVAPAMEGSSQGEAGTSLCRSEPGTFLSRRAQASSLRLIVPTLSKGYYTLYNHTLCSTLQSRVQLEDNGGSEASRSSGLAQLSDHGHSLQGAYISSARQGWEQTFVGWGVALHEESCLAVLSTQQGQERHGLFLPFLCMSQVRNRQAGCEGRKNSC